MNTGALRDLYGDLERTFRPEEDANYERLVVAADAVEEPVHRWFRMKEAYSPHLLPRLLKELRLEGSPRLRVLDPFSGSGTTLASVLLWGAEGERRVIGQGFEVNPFLHLLSSVKAEALSLESGERLELSRAVEAGAVKALSASGSVDPVPELAAFKNGSYFRKSSLERLLQIRGNLEAVRPGLARDLLHVALAAVVEPSSYLRRDGRALRYVPARVPIEPSNGFVRKCKQIANDLRLIEASGTAHVIQGDGRALIGADPGADIAVFSPPYPNNIDYTEVYKLESWILRLIRSREQFIAQREVTMRSHPSISWALRSDGPADSRLNELLRPLLSALPADRYMNERQQVIKGYLQDSLQMFENLNLALRSGGTAVCVVGNSRHGGDDGITFAADLLLSRIAELCGFEVRAIRIARQLSRRGKHPLLRESILLLTNLDK